MLRSFPKILKNLGNFPTIFFLIFPKLSEIIRNLPKFTKIIRNFAKFTETDRNFASFGANPTHNTILKEIQLYCRDRISNVEVRIFQKYTTQKKKIKTVLKSTEPGLSNPHRNGIFKKKVPHPNVRKRQDYWTNNEKIHILTNLNPIEILNFSKVDTRITLGRENQFGFITNPLHL